LTSNNKQLAGLSRRQLLQTAAAIALPTVVPASVFGKQGRPAPSERITVAVIGCGKMAFDYHFPELLNLPDVQVLAACDVDKNRRLFGKRLVEDTYRRDRRPYKGCKEYSDFRDVLARQDIDAVLIATPEHWHAIQLILACKAGKDVYCEKPLALTLAESKACVDAARKYKRVVQTGSQQRSNVFGRFRQACEYIQSGRIGQIKRVTVGVGGPSRPCDLPKESAEPALDWDMWLGPAPMRPYNAILSPRGVHNHFPAWREYREYAGGAHSDMGAHFYDIVQWALGMDLSGPVEIIPPSDHNAQQGVKFIYSNGVEMTHGGPGGCVFTGTRGTLHIDRGILTSDPTEAARGKLGAREVHLFESPGHHRNWIDCIRSRQKPVADVEVGARSVAITQLGNLAYWKDQRLRWDPKTWKLVGSNQMSDWLDRERRDPWRLPKV
jgi:predicted dehydrogenase